MTQLARPGEHETLIVGEIDRTIRPGTRYNSRLMEIGDAPARGSEVDRPEGSSAVFAG
jgi:hypothetical protein